MNGRGKELSREVVNEYFTKEEIDLFRDYLSRKYGTALYVCEHSIPIDTMLTRSNGEKTYYYSLTDCSYSSNTLEIYKANYYDLPFDVAGQYDPDDGVPEKAPEQMP